MAFHWYGFLIGLAIVTSILAFEAQARRFAPRLISHPRFWWLIVGTILGGILAARAWHVVTDWHLYAHQPMEALHIWQGGLSILGAIAGGLLTCWLLLRLLKITAPFPLLADLVVFGLPVSQAIGRLGNYLNQELYGLPAQGLPWSISIDEAHRLPEYVQFSRFHPLFAYEGLMLLGIAWWLYQRAKTEPQRVGTGFFVTWYLLAYSWIRFWLDFLRPDKTEFMSTGLGVNQLVLMGCMMLCVAYAVRQSWLRPARRLLTWLIVCAVVIVGLRFASFGQVAGQRAGENQTFVQGARLTDHQDVLLQVGSRELRVEVVTTPESWTQGLSGRSSIGADGMLFIFPTREVRSFWMPDMQFDLDMVWIADGVVSKVTAHVPKPSAGQSRDTLPVYSSDAPVNWVLELPAGKAGEYGIAPGTSVMINQSTIDLP